MYVVKNGQKQVKEKFDDIETFDDMDSAPVTEGYKLPWINKEVPLWVLIALIVGILSLLVVIFILISGLFSKKEEASIGPKLEAEVAKAVEVPKAETPKIEAPKVEIAAPEVVVKGKKKKVNGKSKGNKAKKGKSGKRK